MDKKKILVIVSILIIVASVAVSVFLIVKDKPKGEDEFIIEGIDLPKNRDILKDVSVDGLKITDVSLLTRDGMSTFKAHVINETSEEVDIERLTVIFHNGDTKIDVIALMETKIDVSGDRYINIEADTDLSEVTKIEYVLK